MISFLTLSLSRTSRICLKQSKFIRKEHEYILIYAKDRDNLEFTKLKNTMEFSNPDNDPKGEWFSSNAASPNQNTDKNKFPIKLPNGNECVRSWKFSLDDFQNGKVSLYFKNDVWCKSPKVNYLFIDSNGNLILKYSS